MIPLNFDKLIEQAKGLAKQLDTPEMRKLYREQKAQNGSLDDLVNELTEEVKNSFEHIGVTPDE